MKGNLQIHIPQPCHEDWQKMTPTQQGRFCQSCAKQVVDFSLMTDNEVLNYFTNNTGKTCGRFAADQLQRPLQPIKQEKRKWWWVAALMTSSLLFQKSRAQNKDAAQKLPAIIDLDRGVSGLVSYSYERQQRQLHKKQPSVTQITVERQKGNSHFAISGRLTVYLSTDAIPFGNVTIKNSKISAIADADGYFKLQGDTTTNKIQLSVAAVGFTSKEVTVVLKDTGTGKASNYLNVKGRVVDKHNGDAIPFAIVFTDGQTKAAAVADSAGYFSLHYTGYDDTIQLTAKGVGYKESILPYNRTDRDVIIKCKRSRENELQIVYTGYTICRKPITTDTFPALIQRIFLPQPFKIFPNPATRGSSVNIQLREQGDYAIQLSDNTGRLLQVDEFNAVSNNMQTSIPIPSSASAGIYYITLVNNNTQKRYTSKLSVQ